MRKLFSKLYTWLSYVWKSLVAKMREISRSSLYHFITGLIVGAFSCISLDMGVWCFVPVLFVSFIKGFISQWRRQSFDWAGFAVTMMGGLLIALFAL